MSATTAEATPDSTSTAGTRLQLLSCNILAGTSVSGYRDYVTKSWTQVLPARSKRNNLDELALRVAEFDLVGLQEADAGSLRSGFLNQIQYLAETARFPFWSHQPNRKVGQFAHSSNGLLSRREPIEVIDYPLPGRIPGRGVLWARYGPEWHGLVILVAHLSLGPKARRRQLDFVAELIGSHSHAILMGDLNCTADSAELQGLYARTSLTPPPAPPPTFPSWRPLRAIDHILVSQHIHVEHLRTLPHAVSDHLPLAASIRLD